MFTVSKTSGFFPMWASAETEKKYVKNMDNAVNVMSHLPFS